MKVKRIVYLLLALLGAALILTAIFVFPQEAQKKAAGICYGLGAAAFGLGASWFTGTFISGWNSEKAKARKAVNVKDERNTLIRDKASAMVAKFTTWGLILWIILASFFFYSALTVLPPVILLVLRFFVLVTYTDRYAKTM